MAKKREYTRGEEIFNWVSHLVGVVMGVIALVIGIVFAVLGSDIYAIISMSIYGVSLIILYTMSFVYHFLKAGRGKNLFRIFDHCGIFLLIAGTYTPYCLIALREQGAWGWAILGFVWSMAILGITFNAIDMHNKIVKRLSMAAYIIMGWCVVVAFIPLINVLALEGFILLLAGGVAYTVGAIFYAFGRKVKYIHSVWHLFVLLGSILQYLSVILYVL